MLPRFSVNKPYTILVAVIVVLILGAVSVINMSTDLLPSMNLPYAIVATIYPGASPEEVELAVSRPIEQSMLSLSNIRNVNSISSENISIVILEFFGDTNMDTAMIEIRESLDMIKAYMPDSVNSPMILRINPDMLPISVLSVAVEGQSLADSSAFIQNTIIPEFERIDGVASVSASGLLESTINVILNDEKIQETTDEIQQTIMSAVFFMPGLLKGFDFEGLEDFAITPELIAGMIQGQNLNVPAGYLSDQGTNYLVRTGDRIKSIKELEQLPIFSIPIGNIPPVVLSDIADISITDNSETSYNKVNGKDSIVLTIQKQAEHSTSDVAAEVRQRAEEIMKKHEGVTIVPLMDQGKYVDIVLDSIVSNLISGGVLAILVLLLFLRDIKPTIAVGLSIPISLVTAFVLMYFSNVSLNIISMGGLALGVGMLVDNSIVVIENIFRMRSEGKSAKEAAIQGANQVAGAIASSTLTTIAVFLPIVFTKGLTRQVFSDMGLTITFSLLASLLVALTLVPVIAANTLKNTKKTHRTLDKPKGLYNKVLNFALNKKWAVISFVLILFVLSLLGSLRVGTEFFPAADTGQLMVQVSLTPGTSFENAVATADKIGELISKIDEVETVGAQMGGGSIIGLSFGSLGGNNSDSLSYYVLLKDERSKSTHEIAQIIREKTADIDAEITVTDTSMDISTFAGGEIAVTISGRDLDTLQALAMDFAEKLRSVEGTVDVSDGIGKRAAELKINVDKAKGIGHGITVAQVFLKVNQLLSPPKATTTLTVGNRDYDIVVTDQKSLQSLTIDELRKTTLPSMIGGEISIEEISEISESEGFSSIYRENLQRYVTVTAGVADGYNIGLVGREVEALINDFDMPEGYRIAIGGEQELITDAFDDLTLMLVLGVILIYLVMVAQFQSLLSPFIVMFTIPLAFTGGFLALLFTNNPLSIVAFLGLIILTGIVVNNGIVFVDYVNQLRESGMEKRKAIIEAGNTRLRPILMTAITTIFGLSTMSIGLGMGAEMIQPLAITTIGGLIYATALTLVFIPVLYDLFHRDKADVKQEKQATLS
ncbi:MAG: efflux RND transporter permease subunit [Firmicutes bacterium]|nr:efflux RND transporter permease subunit [Bacillota bacterium]